MSTMSKVDWTEFMPTPSIAKLILPVLRTPSVSPHVVGGWF